MRRAATASPPPAAAPRRPGGAAPPLVGAAALLAPCVATPRAPRCAAAPACTVMKSFTASPWRRPGTAGGAPSGARLLARVAAPAYELRRDGQRSDHA